MRARQVPANRITKPIIASVTEKSSSIPCTTLIYLNIMVIVWGSGEGINGRTNLMTVGIVVSDGLRK